MCSARVRCGVCSTLMPLVSATCVKLDPNVRSLSRTRYFGTCPYGVASRSGTRYPLIGRRARYMYVDDFLRFQFDDKEGQKRTEEEACHLQEITSPHLCRMIAEKGLPLLSTRPFSTNVPHILLKSSLTYSNIQLEKLAPNALCSPEPIVCCHLLDQADRLGGESLHPRSGFRFALPI